MSDDVAPSSGLIIAGAHEGTLKTVLKALHAPRAGVMFQLYNSFCFLKLSGPGVSKLSLVNLCCGMKRAELARTLARKKKVSPAAARDEVDEQFHKIIKLLRSGKPVKLPGVGRLTADKR